MFKKKQQVVGDEPVTFNLVNLIVGMARTQKLNPVTLVKNAIDFKKNTDFINQMNEQIEKETIKVSKNKK